MPERPAFRERASRVSGVEPCYSSRVPLTPLIEGWFRSLEDGRLEIFLKVDNVQGVLARKIRASGPAAEMNELADWFEEKTGLKINAPWRVVKDRPIPGQVTFEFAELQPGDAP